MAIATGTYQVGPGQGRLLLRTSRQGAAARAGHDLTIGVTRWRATAEVNLEDPGASSVRLEVDATSLEVREGTGGIKPLTDKDRADIKETIDKKVLHTDQHPEITFSSTRVSPQPGEATQVVVEGELTIQGRSGPVSAEVALRDVEGGARVRGRATVAQTGWGIKPYSGFLGALKVSDEVEVEIDVELASS
ncbi:MAG TPA: YceI family protein [Acidimicrobiales bacterium]|jgi:polyisoprenoid-binding protein YceI|nr:YceI family protein [Acidimicrobiales bacterium]